MEYIKRGNQDLHVGTTVGICMYTVHIQYIVRALSLLVYVVCNVY